MRKKSNRAVQDELRPEYDFRSLRVVARGPGRIRLKSPRFGWAEAAKAMHARGEDRLLDEHTSTRFDDETWQW